MADIGTQRRTQLPTKSAQSLAMDFIPTTTAAFASTNPPQPTTQ